MSAFIISIETMNSILPILDLCSEICAKYGYKPKEYTKLGNDLFAMNYDAINQRYGEKTPSIDFTPHCHPIILMGLFGKCGYIQIIKSLHCLHYQCSEGDIPETNILYKMIEECSLEVSEQLVRKLPQYESTQWDL